ncbi:hypothetical protein HS5_03630 [Acidianus sp. HS-5]|nr:hypothetical protein HS5_03630 [Acidianus sp. HS-5]
MAHYVGLKVFIILSKLSILYVYQIRSTHWDKNPLDINYIKRFLEFSFVKWIEHLMSDYADNLEEKEYSE